MIQHSDINKAQCRQCGDVIESISVHDFVTCTCGAIAVDGGLDYLRRVGDPSDFIDLSEPIDWDDEYALEYTDRKLTGVHNPRVCAGRSCSVHSKSEHNMRSLKQDPQWTVTQTGNALIMYRVCEHGERHVDPDEGQDYLTDRGFSPAWRARQKKCPTCFPKGAK